MLSGVAFDATARAALHRERDRLGHRREGKGAVAALGLRHRLGAHRAAHDQLDARDALALRVPQRQQPLGVVRRDPRFQEAGRYGEIDRVGIGFLEVDAREPAREYVLAEFGAQALLDPQPLFRIRPGRSSLFRA
jgi:hypothetical protein